MKPSDSLHHYLQGPEHPIGPNPAQRGPGTTHTKTAGPRRLSDLQLLAWAMANWGYQVPDGSAYRAEAMDLYREDLHERIAVLFAGLDAQNAEIEAALALIGSRDRRA